MIGIFLITLKDSYAYYETSNELEIMKATIGKLKPTIDKVFIESENQQYTNKTSPNVTITWSDDNITEYCVTTEGTCSAFTTIQDPNSKSVTTQIQLSGEGLKIVNAYIKNKYGYTSVAGQSSITLDTTAPTISNVTSTEITETTITVSVSGIDANGISQYCYGTSQNDYTCTDSNTHIFNGLNPGQQYTFWFYLTDNAGNSSAPTQEQFTTISKSAKDVVVATSRSLEPEDALTARNAEIAAAEGDVLDDLRRFVGTYETVTDNFICFGTNDQQTCKDNMDTYMYRIIGIDTSGRLKVIKATKIVEGSQNTFEWHSSKISNVKWNASSLYKGLNGITPSSTSKYICNKCFVGSEKYNYMNNNTWTNLIDPSTYYIGNSTSGTNPTLFQDERRESFTNAKIGLMYISDYLYASGKSTNNWLFIQNGLNGNHNSLGSGATAPTAEDEWTITKYGTYNNGAYYAWYVADYGAMNSLTLTNKFAVRPVFYLKATTRISGGNGQIGTPYMIAP